MMISWILLHPIWSLVIAFGGGAALWFITVVFMLVNEQNDLDLAMGGFRPRSWRDRYTKEEWESRDEN